MKKYLAIFTALLAVLSIATGCAMSYTSQANQPAAGNANFRLLLSDEPNAIDDFATVMVTIKSIGLLPAGEDKEWNNIELDPAWQGDLKTLLGENASQVWAGIIPEGDYAKAFIYVESIEATLAGDTPATVKIPSGKLQMSKPFSVTADKGVDFVFDITIIKAGESGQYIVKPQIGESGADKDYKEVSKQEQKETRETKTNSGIGRFERDAKIRGTVEAINGTTWTVTIGGESITVDVSAAQFKGEPAVGLKVKINGTEGEDGKITASFVHVLGAEDDEETEEEGERDEDKNEIEFSGPVTSLSPLVIAGHTVISNDATKTKGELAVGATVEVEGTLQEDGTVLAKKISVEENEDEEEDGDKGTSAPGKPETTKEKGNNGKGPKK